MSRSKRPVGGLELGDDDVPDVPLVDLAVADVTEADRSMRRPSTRRPLDGPAAFGADLERRADEVAEQRVRSVGPALELRMGLRADPVRVLGQLDELDEPAVGRDAAAARSPAASSRAR